MKRKSLFQFLFTSLAILLLTAAPCAQSSPATDSPANKLRILETSQDASETVQRGLVNACASLREAFKASENHIISLENELDKSRKVNTSLTEKVALLERALAARTEEADAWRKALEAQKEAIDRLTALAEKQEARNAKLEASNKRRGKMGLVLGVAGFVGGLFLK